MLTVINTKIYDETLIGETYAFSCLDRAKRHTAMKRPAWFYTFPHLSGIANIIQNMYFHLYLSTCPGRLPIRTNLCVCADNLIPNVIFIHQYPRTSFLIFFMYFRISSSEAKLAFLPLRQRLSQLWQTPRIWHHQNKTCHSLLE